MMKKRKLTFIIAYTVLLLLTFLYVRSIINQERVQIYKEKKKETKETYPISVSLILSSGFKDIVYTKEMKSDDNVKKLLKEMREDDNLIYELNEYTYGTEIISVNGVVPRNGYKWAILLNNKDITLNMEEIDLIKNGSYILKIIETK